MRSKLLKRTTRMLIAANQTSKASLNRDTDDKSMTDDNGPFKNPQQKSMQLLDYPECFGQEILNEKLAKTENKFWQRTDKYTMSMHGD